MTTETLVFIIERGRTLTDAGGPTRVNLVEALREMTRRLVEHDHEECEGHCTEILEAARSAGWIE